MPVCEPPERGPGAQQIGTLDSLVPPACVCVFMCLCVCLCGERANIFVCVCVHVHSEGYFVYFSGTLWLRVASAADALSPSSFSSSSSAHFLSLSSSLLTHFWPYHTCISHNITRINCMFQPSQQLLFFRQAKSQRITLIIFYIYLTVNKCYKITRNNTVLVSILSDYRSWRQNAVYGTV